MNPRTRKRCLLKPLKLEALPPVSDPVPQVVDAFLTDANARIDAFFEKHRKAKDLGFFPSDYPLIYGVLRQLQKLEGDRRRFCEWGSGFGVIAGLASMLGFESCGIEIDRRLVTESRALLTDHHLDVEILEGNFMPDSYQPPPELEDLETIHAGVEAGANDEVDVDIDDFDLIFAFPWPGDEGMFCDLFKRFAANGALLMTYSALEGIRIQRLSAG